MISAKACPLPEQALLAAYLHQADYLDCFVVDVDGPVSLADYILAFYTSPAFKPERILLGVLLRMPSTDDDAYRLAHAASDRFAAWHVEQRSDNQILLCDYQKRSRSWLMAMPLSQTNTNGGTRLYFGTAMMPVEKTKMGRAIGRSMIWSLTWFHKIYARKLLQAAYKKVPGDLMLRNKKGRHTV
jgi:hypothetical protein